MKNWADISWSPAVVAENQQLAEGAFLLRFRRDFSFQAGQVVALGTSPDLAPRLYSIASGENDPFVDILFTEKSGGSLTPMMSRLNPGDSLMVSKPFGTFTRIRNGSVLVAAGTGLAPFISVIKSGKAEDATLIHGVSYPEYFYFADYLIENLAERYHRCCSRMEGEKWFHGRVTGFLKQWEGIDPAKIYYLCGSAEMVVDTRDTLIAKGIPFGNIDAEIFF